MKLMIIIVINPFLTIVNFCNCSVKSLTEIFQFSRALVESIKVYKRFD